MSARRLGSSASLFALCALLASTPAVAAPRGVRLTWADDPTTTMAVSWNSDDVADGRLVWGTDPAALSNVEAADETIAQSAPLGTTFSVHLVGLQPGVRYYYRVGAAGAERPALAEAPFTFRTMQADPCAPLRFILIGDNRADFDGVGPNPLWTDILAEAMAHQPDFFVNTGDMVKNGDNPTEWSNFIDASEFGWAYVPTLVTVGNHDGDAVEGDAAQYNQLFALPRNPVTGNEDYWGLDVGPIHFSSLNTQHASGAELATMAAWADADLGATDRPWKMAFFHKAIYSRGNHSSGEENGGAINASLVPLFDAHDVDFVFNGHSHNYERYVPSRGFDPAFGGNGRQFPAGDKDAIAAGPLPDGAIGTSYVVSGGAGALTTDVFGFTCVDAACSYCTGFNLACDGDVYDRDVAGNVIYEGRHGFVIFDVTRESVAATAWATSAGNIGGAEIIDRFDMIDGAFDLTCGDPGAGGAGGGGAGGSGAGGAGGSGAGGAGGSAAGGAGGGGAGGSGAGGAGGSGAGGGGAGGGAAGGGGGGAAGGAGGSAAGGAGGSAAGGAGGSAAGGEPGGTPPGQEPDAGGAAADGGCGCTSASGAGPALLLFGLAVLARRRRAT